MIDNDKLVEETKEITMDISKPVELNTPDEVWTAFKENGDEDFRAMLGYGISEIEVIGYEKFVAAMGWISVSNIESYKKDAFNIIICPSCREDFGILQEGLGLCTNCLPMYDTRMIPEIDTFLYDDESKLPTATVSFINSSIVRSLFALDKTPDNTMDNNQLYRLGRIYLGVDLLSGSYKYVESKNSLVETVRAIGARNYKVNDAGACELSDFLNELYPDPVNGAMLIPLIKLGLLRKYVGEFIKQIDALNNHIKTIEEGEVENASVEGDSLSEN